MDIRKQARVPTDTRTVRTRPPATIGLGGSSLDSRRVTRNAQVSPIIEQRPGRALNVPTTAVALGHSRVKEEREPAA